MVWFNVKVGPGVNAAAVKIPVIPLGNWLSFLFLVLFLLSLRKEKGATIGRNA
jgi:hypothetical protein